MEYHGTGERFADASHVCAQPHYVADLLAVECSISKSYTFTFSEVRSHRVFTHTSHPMGCRLVSEEKSSSTRSCARNYGPICMQPVESAHCFADGISDPLADGISDSQVH